ncbi:dockerin type I domain-containing protein [Roseiconus lacunae]|uniref:Dockerin type I domain-containing protein n=1 Tax=Roseiconus lacunae TaxID=2605694 RepID=A0ABT7PNN2_9BACT|nr:dockerin type I domain-containing protein [Roseiconus lacunae]MDM4018092.1 dockerin type I domain-containing protein [Roseiconus lacunae]
MPQFSRRPHSSRLHDRRSSNAKPRLKRRRRRLFAESLERRELLAGDAFVFNIPDDPSLQPDEINRTRISVVEGALLVYDLNQDAVLAVEPLSEIGSIEINGGSDSNELVVDFIGGDFMVPITYEGGDQNPGPGDSLNLQNGSVETIAMGFVDEHRGTIDLESDPQGLNQAISYSGLEPILVGMASQSISFTFLGGDESISLSDDVTPGDGVNRIDSSLGEVVSFVSPSDLITVNGGSGVDQIQISELDSATATTELIVNGDEADDNIFVDHLSATLSATINGGEGADTITVTSPAGTLDTILGSLVVNGGAQPVGVISSETVTAKGNDVSAVLDAGDALMIDDSGTVGLQTYEVTGTSVSRLGSPTITYGTIEQLTLRTGSGNDLIDVQSTAAIETVVETNNGDDQLDLTTTAAGSLLRVDLGAGSDAAIISSTGDASVTVLQTGQDDDDISIQATGPGSGLSIDTGTESDLVNLLSVGSDSVNQIMTGEGIDIVNVRTTATDSFTDVFTGDSADTINVSSDANGNRLVPSGTLAGTLDGLLGELCVFAGGNSGIPENSASVTVKGAAVTATVPVGDVLNISDQGTVVDHVYTLTNTAYTRQGQPEVVYDGAETLNLVTGAGNDQVTVQSTAVGTTRVETSAGEDTLSIETTGDGGILTVDTGTEDDTITMTDSGLASVTELITGAGEDDIIISGTGVQSGVRVSTGSESDVVTVQAIGVQSVLHVRTDDGDDIANLQTTAVDSFVEIYGGNGNDTFNVSSAADGDRVSPVGNLNGSLDGITGQVCLFGDSESVPPEIVDSLMVKTETVSVTAPRGDQVNFSDRATLVDHQYNFTSTELARSGGPEIDLATMESFGLETGSGNDLLNVNLFPPSSAVSFDTGAGDDTVVIPDTGNQSLMTVETGSGEDTVTVTTTGDGSLLRVATGDGDDDVEIAGTGLSSGLAIDGGSDIDVVTLQAVGESSVNSIQAGAGDDVVNVQSTAALSVTEILGGADDDSIVVSSDANGDRLTPRGTPSGDLDGLLGQLCLDGQSNDPTLTLSETVTAKAMDVTVSIAVGDSVYVSDASAGSGQTYTINDGSFERSGGVLFELLDTELLDISTSMFADTVTINDTADATFTRLDSVDGDDAVDVITSGSGSIVTVETGSGSDLLTVLSTGDDGIVKLSSGQDDDDVEIVASGQTSGIGVDAGSGIDLIDVRDTGTASFLEVRLGSGDDIANVQGTGADSRSDFFGDDDDDTFNLTDNADGTRLNPRGTQTGTLDGLRGQICVFGVADTAADSVTVDVQAHRTDADVANVSETVELGDELNVIDNSSLSDQIYDITAAEIQRTGINAVTITYGDVESVKLESGSGNDTVNVASTAEEVYTQVLTHDGNDTVTITTTGQDSIVDVITGTDEDQVSITTTGTSSITGVTTDGGSDTFETGAIGNESGLMVHTGDEDDAVSLLASPTSPTGPNESLINIQAGLGADAFEVNEVYLNTVVDLQGGADNDNFRLIADGADSTGYLRRLNDDPNNTPTLDSAAATRQLFIDGGANEATTRPINEGAGTIGANMNPIELSEPAIEVGDRIVVDASSATVDLDLRYVITGPAEGVFATTVPGSPRATVGNEVFETASIESVDILTGSADDLMTISSDIPFDIGTSLQRIGWSAGAGTDKIEVQGTVADDQITIGNLGDAVDEPMEISGVEFIRIAGEQGDDQLVNRTAVMSVIDGLAGNDIMFGGSGQDLLTGGSGVDLLYARDGNDILFSDQDLGSNTPDISDGEILDGGSENVIPLGDICIQHGADQIRTCEVVGDGGGEKDVLTWLRAIFIDPDVISFDPLHPALTPFLPAFPNPVPLLAVTEPSKLPLGALASEDFPTTPEDLSVAMDVNRDGAISPLDALSVINTLAIMQAGEAEPVEYRSAADVNGNGIVEPRDALMLINYLAVAKSQSEGSATASTNSDSDSWAWLDSVDHIFGEDDDESWLNGDGVLF